MNQQSRVIFWLLLAATLCVDAVAVSWAYVVTLNRAETLYFALLSSQLSVLAIWATFSAAGKFQRWLVLPTTLIVASLLTNSLFDPALDGGRFETGLLYLAFLLTQAAVLLLGLWLLRQSFLRRHFPNAGLRWQFSIKYLFVLMTTVALITILLRHVELIREISIPFVAWIVNNAAIAMAVVVIRLAPWHPMLRVGATAWVAAISGAVMAAIAPNGLESLAVNFIQAIVLQLWLELGGVIPQPDATDGTTSSPTPMPSQEA